MKPGDHEQIPTVSEVVREATAFCDPDGSETAVLALFEAFEDDDRPATAAEDLRGELLSSVRGIDPEDDSPAAAAAAATAFWLSTNPAQDADEHSLREGVRLTFEGKVPDSLGRWLEARAVDV